MNKTLKQMNKHRNQQQAQKGQKTAQNGTQNAETAKAEQSTGQSQNKPKITLYPQITRQFGLMRASVERCHKDFPDCFHFKLQTAKECRIIADCLKHSVATLAKHTEKHDKDAQRAIKAQRYLIRQFESVIAEVERVAQLAQGAE